eukprot:COSAG05_NODE_4228_length_1613_cov_13.535007_1_plen_160_part_00
MHMRAKTNMGILNLTHCLMTSMFQIGLRQGRYRGSHDPLQTDEQDRRVPDRRPVYDGADARGVPREVQGDAAQDKRVPLPAVLLAPLPEEALRADLVNDSSALLPGCPRHLGLVDASRNGLVHWYFHLAGQAVAHKPRVNNLGHLAQFHLPRGPALFSS